MRGFDGADILADAGDEDCVRCVLAAAARAVGGAAAAQQLVGARTAAGEHAASIAAFAGHTRVAQMILDADTQVRAMALPITHHGDPFSSRLCPCDPFSFSRHHATAATSLTRGAERQGG